MRSKYLVRIYDDKPLANPKAVEFIIRDDGIEDARERAADISRRLFPDQNQIHMHVLPDASPHYRSNQYEEGDKVLVSFKAIHIPRVQETVSPMSFIKIPKSTGWFARAECHMTAEELQRMASEGISFRVHPPAPGHFVANQRNRHNAKVV